MRDRVLAAADKLGYRPNAIARGLITRRSNMIAVVIPQIVNRCYPDLIGLVTKRFSERGIRVMLFMPDSEVGFRHSIDALLQYRVDGLLSLAAIDSTDVSLVSSAGIPIVLFDQKTKTGNVSAVRCDQLVGVRRLVDKLVETGHRSFGISACTDAVFLGPKFARTIRGRLMQLSVRDVTTVIGDCDYKAGRRAFAAIVQQRGSAPDAVLAAADVVALGCIDEARDRFRLKVPTDVSIVAAGGTDASQYAAYDLTTVGRPHEQMVACAAEMLMEQIENPEAAARRRVFRCVSIDRGTARLQND